MTKQESDKEIIGKVFNSILDLANEERRNDPEYKDLWEKDGVAGVLRESEHKMMKLALSTNQVLKEKYGVKITNEKWDLIMSLPMVLSKLEKHIQKTEGSACCVDKAYHLVSKILNN